MIQQTVAEMIDGMAEASHCEAGAAIALSGALAAALAKATANVTLMLATAADTIEFSRNMQVSMAAAHLRFQAIATEDAQAIGEFVRLREGGQPLKGYQLLCDGPQEMAHLALDAATHMQTYRAFVCERTRDDLEFALTLMIGTAQAALQLLDSNLRIWPLPELLAQFDAVVDQLSTRIAQLTPRQRIREM